MSAKKTAKASTRTIASRKGPVLEGTTAGFVDSLAAAGGPPIYKLPVEAARKLLDDLQSKPVPKLTAQVEDLTIPVGPTGETSIRIVRPEKASGTLPAVIYTHGGGWILGNANTHDRLVRELANGVNAAIVFVNYTPSPEAKYPTAVEQAFATAKYIAEKGAAHNIDTTRIAIVGDSVGGNMAAAVTLLAKDRGGPKFAYQVMLYPVTDAGMNTASYKQFANGPWLTRKAMAWFWDAYEPRVASRKKPTVSPLQAPLAQLKGLPPALLITDENDVLRDEGEAYGRKLTEAGVPVTAVRCLQTIHDFAMLNPLADTHAARTAIGLTIVHLSHALGTAATQTKSTAAAAGGND
jgi:acetyl esterase